MDFRVNQGDLKIALDAVKRAIDSRALQDIYRNFLIQTEGAGTSWVRVIGFDPQASCGMTAWVEAQVDEEGAIALPTSLADIVALSDGEEVRIRTEKRLKVSLTCGESEDRLIGVNPDDFVPVPVGGETPDFEMSAADLKAMIAQTMFCAAKTESTYAPLLQGVQFRIEGEYLYLTATDSYQLAVARKRIDYEPEKPLSFVLRAGDLSPLQSILDKAETVKIYLPGEDQDTVIFRVDQIDFSIVPLDGSERYVQFELPTNPAISVPFSKAALMRALDRANIFSRDRAGVIEFVIPAANGGSRKVEIVGRSPERGSNITRIESKVTGGALSIMARYGYLSAGLKNMPGNYGVLELWGESDALLLRPLTEGQDGEALISRAYTYVLSPVTSEQYRNE